MIRRQKFPIVALLTAVFLFAPVFALGAGMPTQIVTCSGPNCSVCDLANLAQNVLNTAIYLAVFLSAVLFAWAGWEALTAAGSAEKVGHARTIFGNVVLGLVIILAGWLVIDTLMKTMTNGSFGPWNKICELLVGQYFA
jgi:hypothetical protein